MLTLNFDLTHWETYHDQSLSAPWVLTGAQYLLVLKQTKQM